MLGLPNTRESLLLCCGAMSTGLPDRMDLVRSFELKLPSDRARFAAKGLRILIVFRPAYPFTSSVESQTEASADLPVQARTVRRYLTGQIAGLIVYNALTGEVFDRILTPFGESQVEETFLAAGDRTGMFRIVLPRGTVREDGGGTRAPVQYYTIDATSTQIRSFFRNQLRTQGWTIDPGSFTNLTFTSGTRSVHVTAGDGRFELSQQ